ARLDGTRTTCADTLRASSGDLRQRDDGVRRFGPNSYRSLPAYERLKLLLTRGKSGTIVSASATGSAGQLKKLGSTIFTRLSSPSGPSSTRCTIVPRQPSTMPTPEPAAPPSSPAVVVVPLRGVVSRWR